MKADGVGRLLLYTALLAASAVLLLLMVCEYVHVAHPVAYTSSALDGAQVTELPALPANWLLNAGDAEALDQLPGIGPVLAQRIIESRTLEGPFVFPEDLTAVKGIGEKTLASILQWLNEHPESAYVWETAGE